MLKNRVKDLATHPKSADLESCIEKANVGNYKEANMIHKCNIYNYCYTDSTKEHSEARLDDDDFAEHLMI